MPKVGLAVCINYLLVSVKLSVDIQGVPRNIFHYFSSTCDNLTKKCFKQKLISF